MPALTALLLAAAVSADPAEPFVESGPVRAYVGTYTDGASRGIYRLSVDPETGELGEPELAAEAERPSFLALPAGGDRLYAVSELFGGGKADGLLAFRVEDGGDLARLNARPTAAGDAKAGACHVAVNAAGTVAIAANYGGGSVASFPIAEDGALGRGHYYEHTHASGANENRQTEPHVHSATFSPDGRFAVVADLGGDRLYVYRVNETDGSLEPHDPPFTELKPGGGPRHFAFHPDGKRAYAGLEMTCEIAGLTWDADAGTLTVAGYHDTLPAGANRVSASTAEVLVHPSGRFVYISNRGHDSVAVFRVGDGADLSRVEVEPAGVKIPRGMGLTPGGRFLLTGGQKGGGVASFAIDPATGTLTPTGSSVDIDAAVCIRTLTVE